MRRTARRCVLACTMAAGMWAAASHAETSTTRKAVAHPKPELATAADAAVDRGLHAQLPPHVSTLLGLTHEEACPVLQGVLRSSEKVQGFEVTEKNHDDVVIFVVDETTKDQTFYLTSPSGALRKLLSVQEGVGRVVKPTKNDVEAFEREKKMWKERLAGQTETR